MISVTILTKNSAKTLRQTLKSVEGFGEVLVYDTGSTDETIQIAKSYPYVTLLSGPFEGFGKTHNSASSLAKYDWILSIDSDEELTKELKEEILALTLDEGSVYSFRRKNLYRGKWIRSAGWWPDSVVRLYSRKKTSFSLDAVHERVLKDGLSLYQLEGVCLHQPYHSVSDFLRKMQHYSDLFAEQNKKKRSLTMFTAVSHALYAFFKAYILQRGILEGSAGFEIAVYQANCCFYKYLKLKDASGG